VWPRLPGFESLYLPGQAGEIVISAERRHGRRLEDGEKL
jgi:hypothetical protein